MLVSDWHAIANVITGAPNGFEATVAVWIKVDSDCARACLVMQVRDLTLTAARGTLNFFHTPIIPTGLVGLRRPSGAAMCSL